MDETTTTIMNEITKVNTKQQYGYTEPKTECLFAGKDRNCVFSQDAFLTNCLPESGRHFYIPSQSTTWWEIWPRKECLACPPHRHLPDPARHPSTSSLDNPHHSLCFPKEPTAPATRTYVSFLSTPEQKTTESLRNECRDYQKRVSHTHSHKRKTSLPSHLWWCATSSWLLGPRKNQNNVYPSSFSMLFLFPSSRKARSSNQKEVGRSCLPPSILRANRCSNKRLTLLSLRMVFMPGIFLRFSRPYLYATSGNQSALTQQPKKQARLRTLILGRPAHATAFKETTSRTHKLFTLIANPIVCKILGGGPQQILSWISLNRPDHFFYSSTSSSQQIVRPGMQAAEPPGGEF